MTANKRRRFDHFVPVLGFQKPPQVSRSAAVNNTPDCQVVAAEISGFIGRP